jgi:hypothetical protein
MGFEFVDSYKKISPCLLLYFNTEPYVRPIREHRFNQYQELLNIENRNLLKPENVLDPYFEEDLENYYKNLNSKK